MDPKIQAMVPGSFDRESLSKEASSLLERYPHPATRPPLFGVPVGIKDIFRVRGYPTRCGSRLPSELFDGEEAPCVRCLIDSGAIIVGKTVTTEFAWIEPGPTRNPHRLGHTPGGSSSGSAAGVAAGFFPLALGTQTLGSIIRPAAYCGVVGFKPTYGRISTMGIIPFSPSADQVGFFCPDSSALDLISSVLMEDWRPREPGIRAHAPVFAIPAGPYLAQVSPRALDHFKQQLEGFYRADCQIIRLDPFTDLEGVNAALRRMTAGEMARVHREWYPAYRDLYRPRTAATIEEGFRISDGELQGHRTRGLDLREHLERKMDSHGIDLWICPAATDHAPPGLESTGSPVMNIPWTYAGLPALTLPMGPCPGGLPLGLQLVGRYGRDEELVEIAEGLTLPPGSKFRKPGDDDPHRPGMMAIIDL